jgi:NitT/TauT family transport system substrate-binding protein
MRRIAGIAALALGMAFGSVLPASADTAETSKVTFLTNYVFNGRHAPFFVGLEKGFYKDAGFEVGISPATGSGFVIAAIEGGQADFGMADFSTVTQSVAKGTRVKAFSVYTDTSTSGLASIQPYGDPASLLGKKIAAGQTDQVRVILPIILRQKGLDPDGLDWQAADPSVYFSLLMSGQVDLITATLDGDMPGLSKIAAQQNKEVHFSSFAEWGYDVFGFVLVGSKAAVEADPEKARRFAEATRKSVEYARENPGEAADIMVKHNPTMSRDTVEAQLMATLRSMDTAYVEANGYGNATEERLSHAIELVGTALQLKMELAPQDVFALPSP